MVDAARQMLDELMGRNRNLHPSEAGHKVNWEDPDFCQFYNVKFCPHDLFINTRADLGPCARIHDDEAKHLYEEARPSQRKRQYEDEFLRFCNVMLHDVDRKIQKGKQRLQLMQSDQPTAQVPTILSKHQEQINILNARIKKLLAEAEEAGIRGDVDQAQDLMTICEELKEEKDTLQRQYENSATNATSAQRAISLPATGFDAGSPGTTVQEPTPPANNDITSVKLSPSTSLTESNVNANANASVNANANANETNEQDDATSEDNEKNQAASWAQELNAVPEKQMKVCEICGAFLIVGDAQQRIEDHLMGKQHLGYSKLRTAVAEINERRQKEREDEERRRRDERSQRGNVYDHRRDQRDYRARSRDYGGSNRHQSSDKHRYHHKSHHRNSHSHNSRSRSSHHQHYHHQSRERSRSRSRY